MDLNAIWFVLVAVLIAGYAVLDGFDLGVGALSLFARSKEERDLHVAAIGPVWDGNEVWLITGGGALFAAFPIVYATVFSGYYLALMLLLLALIARAVAIEFRALLPDPRWMGVWDWSFGLGSLIPTILFGVAVGNVLRGLPIGPAPDHAWGGSFLGLLSPYALLVGFTSCALFVMHGANYLRMKTDGALEARLKPIALGAYGAFLVLYLMATGATVLVSPFLFGKLGSPLFWLLTAVVAAAIVALPILIRSDRRGLAFIASSTAIVGMIAVTALSAFPVLAPSRPTLANSLTAYNASSSPRTLLTMLVIALIGMPLMLVYTTLVYRVFRGKARTISGYGLFEEARAPIPKVAETRR